ncbi:unnamed protein product [Cochlearia groenlandica]
MADFEDVLVEPELSPGSIEEWLSIIQHGKKIDKGTRRSDLSLKVKKHLSALGWFFAYPGIGKRRDLRYKSPQGKWFYSLASACMNCLDENPKQQQIVPKSDLSCSLTNLDLSKTKKKRKRKRVIDCYDTDVFQGEILKRREKTLSCCSVKLVFNVDVSSKQQETSKGEIRPRIGKSLKNILQAMEKKNEKGEKESLRFLRKDSTPDMNYDVCCVCHLGGELLLCDGCPSAYHHTCLGLSNIPEEDLWFCPCCCCDICESMETPQGNSKLMTCEQCQRRFHLKCVEDPCLVSFKGWFCSSQCSRAYTELQSLLGCKISVGENNDLVWRLIRAPSDGEHYNDEQISKLDSAVKILHQGFEPSKDPFSGRDLVEELVYKRDGTSLGHGYYTVLIERKNVPITAATIRVDKDVVEIPLVSTLFEFRRSGMCRVLMDELEKQMSRIGVCRLVLPAAKEVLTTWTQRFGFSAMESCERLELVKHGMLDFVGTVMCHKFLMDIEKDSGESSLTE